MCVKIFLQNWSLKTDSRRVAAKKNKPASQFAVKYHLFVLINRADEEKRKEVKVCSSSAVIYLVNNKEINLSDEKL